MPFFHNFGLKEGFRDSVIVGGACTVDPLFDPVRLAGLIQAERVTHLGGTPTMYTSFLDGSEALDADISSVWGCGTADRRPVELIRRVLEELTERVGVGYSLSEPAGGISLTTPDSSFDRFAHWAGRLVAASRGPDGRRRWCGSTAGSDR